VDGWVVCRDCHHLSSLYRSSTSGSLTSGNLTSGNLTSGEPWTDKAVELFVLQ